MKKSLRCRHFFSLSNSPEGWQYGVFNLSPGKGKKPPTCQHPYLLPISLLARKLANGIGTRDKFRNLLNTATLIAKE